MDAATGEEIYQERAFSDRYRASPVYADGRIYLASRKGVVTVVRAGRKFEKLAQNELGEELSASLAFSNGRIYLRSFEHLYCIGTSKSSAAAPAALERSIAENPSQK
jgi:outer membrane protein assembly factor BamB